MPPFPPPLPPPLALASRSALSFWSRHLGSGNNIFVSNYIHFINDDVCIFYAQSFKHNSDHSNYFYLEQAKKNANKLHSNGGFDVAEGKPFEASDIACF